MPETPDDLSLDSLLRDGLRRLPTPEPAADFDDRVLAALQHRPSWWQRLWPELRPLLAGASCSLAVMFAALAWATQTPAAPHRPASAPASLSRPLDMAAVDRLLDRPALSAASLAELETLPPPTVLPSDPDRPHSAPTPRRVRASQSQPSLVA